MVIHMFNNYKIINNTLYLYVDDKCEIGSLFNDDRNNSITSKIKNYIKSHQIKFSGTKVILLLSGLMLGTVYLNNDLKIYDYDVYKDNKYVYNIVDKSIPDVSTQEQIKQVVNEAALNIDDVKSDVSDKNKKTQDTNNSFNVTITNSKQENDNTLYSNNGVPDKVITLKRTNGEVLQIGLEEYLIGVVAAEMPASFNSEALKAQAIVARTYTLKLLESGRTITDDVSTQVYKSNSELQSMWKASYNTYYNKVKNAVSATNGLCIKYNGSLIDAVYHSTSNGYTEDSVNVWGNSVPYLKTVTSPWDTSVSSYLKNVTIGFDKISNVLGFDFNSSSSIEIISRDESNRISRIKFNDKEYSGVEIRNLLGLRSADFDFNISDEGVNFTTRGYGHGVGMSQYGANEMSNAGYSYDRILNHYYTNVQIVKSY